jgi:adenylate cyclase
MRVHRCFAFVDMCGFTRMNDTLGDDEAVEVLAAFRALVRRLAPDHGIRVGKWFGDGCMFVSTEVRPIVGGMIDLTLQLESADIVLPLRTGIASGPVILFEGDDFIGMAINLASRLCDAAGPGEILASAEVEAQVGDEFGAVPLGFRAIPGIVTPIEVWRIPVPEREGDGDLPLSFAE